MESFEIPREVRAKIPEARGMKRTSEDDGRADLDIGDVFGDDVITKHRVNAVTGDAFTRTSIPAEGLIFEGCLLYTSPSPRDSR